MASGFGTGEYGKLTYGKGVESGSATPITAGFGQAQADIKHTYNAFAQVQAQIKAIGVNKSGQALAQITTRTPNGQAQTWIASVPQLIQEAHSGGISVTFPNTPTPGNLMILFAADRLGDGPTSLSGWTYIGSADWDVNPGGGLSAFYRVVQSGDSATVTSLTANEWVSEWANARYDSYVTQSFQTTHITAGGPITPSLNTAVALAGVVTQAGTGTEDADVRVRLKDQGFPGGNDPYLWVAYKNVLSNASPTTVGTNVSTDPNHPGWA